MLTEVARKPFRHLRAAVSNGNGSSICNPQSAIRNAFWALDDVSFEVKRGEVVGIIGRNGAGKSTLLKILSRITKPTRGHAEIHGRVGSLLEVGTGFHPELTGRENIYLNAAILGMRKAEVAKKFDEIVAFAEVEKFIDTPVKRYSSGMYVRLAFAIAAHMETEVLIVDEVLAVGDAAFQKKCLGKMSHVAKRGRTVLFVSHDMSAMTRLCERAVLLNEGIVVRDGLVHEIVKTYLDAGFGTTAIREWTNQSRAPGNEIVRLKSVRVCAKNGETIEAIDIRERFGIQAVYEVLTPGHILIPNFHFFNEDGLCLFAVQDVGSEWRHKPRPVGQYCSTAWIPGNFLAEGNHVVDIAVSSHIPAGVIHFLERDALAFQVLDKNEGDSARGDYTGNMPGLIRPVVQWTNSLTDMCSPV